jgi:hypothetical protein
MLARCLAALALTIVAVRARADALDLPRPRLADEAPADWTGRSAHVAPPFHGQAALLAESRLGVGRDLQLGVHLAGLLGPHASVLYGAHSRNGLHISPRLGLAYPAPLYALLSGKGAFALLPANTTPPQVLLFDPGVRASLELPRGQLVSVEVALTLRARFSHGSAPVLDFPFLYPRFAAVHTPITARFGATAEGRVLAGLRWAGSIDAFSLPVVHRGFALEPRLAAAWAFPRRVTLELGERVSYARYPVALLSRDALRGRARALLNRAPAITEAARAPRHLACATCRNVALRRALDVLHTLVAPETPAWAGACGHAQKSHVSTAQSTPAPAPASQYPSTHRREMRVEMPQTP